MGRLARWRRGWAAGRSQVGPPAFDDPAPDGGVAVVTMTSADEGTLWTILREDPNDVTAFHQLAEIVRRRAGEGHLGGDPQRAADDAVWSLAEELAHSGKAWYPLVELARLSIHDDREAALRRLGTAAHRDPSGQALVNCLAMLRDEQLPGDALNLGVGHWRPREHDLQVGRHLVEAAIEGGRLADARRHLDALSAHPDVDGVAELRADLEPLVVKASALMPPGTPAAGVRILDLREVRETPTPRHPFRRR